MIAAFLDWNEQAHKIISPILNAKERQLVLSGDCAQEDAAEWLATEYIDEISSRAYKGQQYLPSDERLGAAFFLHNCVTSEHLKRLRRNRDACAKQLMMFSKRYFKRYETVLRLQLLWYLETETDPQLLRHNGVVLLACATLDTAKDDTQRALRALGCDWEPQLVRDNTRAMRLQTRTAPLSITKGSYQ